jgi:hypothetical protein
MNRPRKSNAFESGQKKRHSYPPSRKPATRFKSATDRKRHIKEYKRQYAQVNRERLNRYFQQWRRDHPGYNTPYYKRYLAKRRVLKEIVELASRGPSRSNLGLGLGLDHTRSKAMEVSG